MQGEQEMKKIRDLLWYPKLVRLLLQK